MTTSTSNVKVFSEGIYSGQLQMNPAIITTHEGQVFVWTSSVNPHICDVRVSEDTNNTPALIVKSSKDFGEKLGIQVPKKVCPNAVIVHQKEKNTFFVYSFGQKNYPYVLTHNLTTHKEENINAKDILDIKNEHAISNAAKTCVFGKNDEYIFITSEDNEVLIYSVTDNKFVKKERRFLDLLSNEDRHKLDTTMSRYMAYTKDSEYLVKVKEKDDVAEFFMINGWYCTLLTIDYKDKKFVIKPTCNKNNFTGPVDDNKITKFGCLYFPEYESIMVCGGIDIQLKSKDYICFYHIRSQKFYFSKLKLSKTLAHHGLAFMPKQNWIVIIPGVTYVNGKREWVINSYYTSLDTFKPVLLRLKKENLINNVNESKKNDD